MVVGGPKKSHFAHAMKRLLKQDDGQVLLLFTLAFVVLLGMAGISVSIGVVYYKKGELQNAVDAAALAGAQQLRGGGNPASQTFLIAENAPGATGTVAQNAQSSSEVDANASLVVNGGFASFFGFPTFTVHAHAAADTGLGAGFNYAVFQGATTPPLDIGGTIEGTTTSVAASVHSNGNIQLQGGTKVLGYVNASGNVTNGSSDVLDDASAEESLGDTFSSLFTPAIQAHQPQLAMPKWPVPTAPPLPSVPNPPSVPSTSSSLYVTGGKNVPSTWAQNYNQSIYVTGGGSAKLNGDNQVNGTIYVNDQGSVTPKTQIVSIATESTVTGPIYAVGGSVNVSSNDFIGDGINGIYVNGGGSVDVQGTTDTVKGDVVVTGGGSATIDGPVYGSIYVTGGGSVTVGGGVEIHGGIYVSGGGSITVGGGDTVDGPVMNDGGYGVTGASITIEGGDTVNGSVTDVGSSIDIYGGDTVEGQVLATEGNGSSNCFVEYGGGGGVGGTLTGSVIDEGGTVKIDGGVQTGNNPGLDVADFPYKGQGGTSISIGGGTTYKGVIYAPNGSVSLNSNPVDGSVIGNTVSLGWTTVTYDPKVVDAAPFETGVKLVQ